MHSSIRKVNGKEADLLASKQYRPRPIMIIIKYEILSYEMLNGEADRRELCSLLEPRYPNMKQYWVHKGSRETSVLSTSSLWWVWFVEKMVFGPGVNKWLILY